MRDRGLTVARGVLRVGNGINWLFGIATLAALLVSFPLGDRLAAHLVAKYPHGDIAGTIAVVRVMALLAIAASVAAHQIFTRLLAIVATVDAGDPFIIDNAARLRRIGWALLSLQLLNLAAGAIIVLLDRMGVDHPTWAPGLTGWIAVVMVFALARVFQVGAAMRDDLAMTV